MAPDLALSTGCFLLEKNRHSPRIFNKLATKLDISKVNTKLDFMKSLNLYCTLNSKESFSKVNNWEVVLPRNSLPLKECSVVISVVKCDVCGQSLNNQTDVEHHKNLHNRLAGLTDNGYASGDDSAKESSEKENMQENCTECNNNNNMSDTEKVKGNKKQRHRRRSKDAVTKVTLKIGGEVISKVYCKKKYLKKGCSKEDKPSGQHHQEDCKNCNEIKDMLRNSKINSAGAAHVPASDAKRDEKSSDTDQSDCNAVRLREMATALVELELRQKTCHVNEGSDFFSEDEFSEEKNGEDDAVVPIVDDDDFVDSNDIDDDIQEVLRKSRSTHDLDMYNTSNEFNTYYEREILHTPIEDCEVITIDDEGCDLEDDCVIVEERLGNQSLTGPENSYVFHVENKDIVTKDVSGVKDKQALSEKRLLINDLLENNISVSKKRKMENVSSLRTGISENLEMHKRQKENKNYQTPSIKLSQFALPLRLINF